ncbi:MAG: hypothetical protein AABZ47_13515 [Planctomycetota bacterium]
MNAPRGRFCTSLVWVSFVLIVGNQRPAHAIDYPIQAELIASWNEFEGNYADVWGDGVYAYVGHFFDAGVDIIDIADPFHPVLLSEIRPNPPNQFASAQDHQVGQGLLFVALDQNFEDGVLIVDVRDPVHPVPKTVVRIPLFSDVHNVFYDNGILYVCNSRTPDIGVVDLTNYNPDNAPTEITVPLWTLRNVGTSFVHDITVKNDRLYASSWNSGLRVYDVTMVRTRQPTFAHSTPGSATHAAWPTQDDKFVVTGEERMSGGIKVYEIRPPSPTGAGSLILRSSMVLPITESFSVHNVLIDGFRLFNSWYQAGLVVLDVNPTSGILTPVAGYDTFPDFVEGFDGAWGVYPYLGEDRILVSDLTTGLHVVDISGVPKIAAVDGLPQAANPVVETPVQVRVVHASQLLPPDIVLLRTEIEGRGFSNAIMTPDGTGHFRGLLPVVPCGQTVRFHFQALTSTGQTISDPPDAPATVYTLPSLTTNRKRFHDDFENDLGWTIGAPGDTAATGIWTRVNPVGTSAQPENDNPLGFGSRCFVTGQGFVEGGNAAADVDGDTTTLTSPEFDAQEGETYVSYARWFSNHLGASPNQDPLTVLISNDAGQSWTLLESVSAGSNRWTTVSFRISDYVAPTATTRVRFVVSDLSGDSLVEAAIDDFVVSHRACVVAPGDIDGNGRFDLVDFLGFPACLSGPAESISEDCSPYDVEGDHDVDLADSAALINGFTAVP